MKFWLSTVCAGVAAALLSMGFTFEGLRNLAVSEGHVRSPPGQTAPILRQRGGAVLVSNNPAAQNDRDDHDHDACMRECWHVLWLVRPQWERHYISDVLTDLDLCGEPVHFDGSPKGAYSGNPQDLPDLRNRTVIVTNNFEHMGRSVTKQVVKEMNARDNIFVIFLLSQEDDPYQVSCGLPDLQNMITSSSLVIRNYWTEDCVNEDKVVIAPLFATTQAYQAGFANHCGDRFGKEPADRETFLYFAGSSREPRTLFVNSIKEEDWGDKSVTLYYPVPRGNEGKELSRRYTQILSDARYSGVVKGTREETWRFTETLFCGAIPFMEKRVHEYYQQWLPADLLEQIPTYPDDPDGIRRAFQQLLSTTDEEYAAHATQLRESAQTWIDSTRKNLARRVKSLSCYQ
jgi:hypothetical protein